MLALFLQLLDHFLILFFVFLSLSAQPVQPGLGILHLELQLIDSLVLSLFDLKQYLILILLQGLIHILRRDLLHQRLLALRDLPQRLLLHLLGQILEPVQLLGRVHVQLLEPCGQFGHLVVGVLFGGIGQFADLLLYVLDGVEG